MLGAARKSILARIAYQKINNLIKKNTQGSNTNKANYSTFPFRKTNARSPNVDLVQYAGPGQVLESPKGVRPPKAGFPALQVSQWGSPPRGRWARARSRSGHTRSVHCGRRLNNKKAHKQKTMNEDESTRCENEAQRCTIRSGARKAYRYFRVSSLNHTKGKQEAASYERILKSYIITSKDILKSWLILRANTRVTPATWKVPIRGSLIITCWSRLLRATEISHSDTQCQIDFLRHEGNTSIALLCFVNTLRTLIYVIIISIYYKQLHIAYAGWALLFTPRTIAKNVPLPAERY